MRALPALILAAALLAGARGAAAQAVHDMEKLVAERPLGDAPVRIDEVQRSEHASIHLIQVRGAIDANYHERHDEWVMIWRGRGKLTIGGGAPIDLAPGGWTLIPKGVLHAFRAEGPETAVVLAMFMPPFDGKDRIVVKDGAAPPRPADAPAEPALNHLLSETHRAMIARDVAALERIAATPLPDGERAKTKAFLDGVSKNPVARFMYSALDGMPWIDRLPEGATALAVEITTEPGPDYLRARAAFKRNGDRWLVAGIEIQPLAEEAIELEALGARDDAAAEKRLQELFGPAFFARADETDLRTLAPEMPSVKGFWRKAQQVEVDWTVDTSETTADRSVVFVRAPGGEWSIPRIDRAPLPAPAPLPIDLDALAEQLVAARAAKAPAGAEAFFDRALRTLPRIVAVPTGATELEIDVETADGPDQASAHARLMLERDAWRLVFASIQPESKEAEAASKLPAAEAEARLFALFQGGYFARGDETDLAPLLAGLSVGEAPVVKGLWRKAVRVELNWAVGTGTGAVHKLVVLKKADGAWRVADAHVVRAGRPGK